MEIEITDSNMNVLNSVATDLGLESGAELLTLLAEDFESAEKDPDGRESSVISEWLELHLDS